MNPATILAIVAIVVVVVFLALLEAGLRRIPEEFGDMT